MIRSVRRGSTRVLSSMLLTLAVLTCLLVFAAGPAAAAPPPPTMSLDALQTAIDASPGGVPGYFKTVLQGADVVQVPVDILAVVDGANEIDGTPLIMFRITDPDVLALGGLAEGMSGSPLYVSAGDALVGGVSYGYYLTTNGFGLATPIDLMATIETDYEVAPAEGGALGAALAGPTSQPLRRLTPPALPKVRTRTLPRPVTVAGRTYRRLLVARSIAAARSLKPAADSAVVVPLTALEVGGLPQGSRAFKQLSADMEKRGVNVVALGAGQGSSDFSAPLEPGASVAGVLASGDFWAYYVGTVTYTDGDTVVAFGHPLDYDGPVSIGLANAKVYGIWSTLEAPFKMVSLGQLQGTFTQDRRYGVAGTLAAKPKLVEIDASAAVPSGAGQRHVDTTTQLPQWVADSVDYGSEFVADACYMPVWLAADSYEYPGYETMHFTMDVADSDGVVHTVDRTNVYDDMYDVGFLAGWDIYDIVDDLLYDENGTAPATIKSVGFEATLEPQHHATNVIDFRIPGGLRVGANTVHVVLRDYGQVATRTVDTIITVPPGLDLSGDVEVYGYGDNGMWDEYYYYDELDDAVATPNAVRLGANTDPPPTVADIVADINGWGKNDAVYADFSSDSTGPDGEDGLVSAPGLPITDGGIDWYVGGDVDKWTAELGLRPTRPFYLPGAKVVLRGSIDAWDSLGTKVALYKGTSTTPFVRVPVRYNADSGNLFFVATLKHVSKTVRVRAVWGGSDEFIGARASCKVRIGGRGIGPVPVPIP